MVSFTGRRSTSIWFCLILILPNIISAAADPINRSAADALAAVVSPGEVSMETDNFDPVSAGQGNGYFISPNQYQRLKVLLRLVDNKRAARVGNIFGSEYLGKRSGSVKNLLARSQKSGPQYPFKRMDASEFLG
ncbi:hypothetical protein RvY_03430 [Ramazzottius varieornatus]|uniref:Uncharacterized protein n=1 Tax=Ramazzottius varieornatus TaxID=947166 RepID=A0A1D1UTS7_RAMVA|nr:hypothetical protein RvY_03430 [Ramazzottius varieornatus]